MSADTSDMENAPCVYVAVRNPKTLGNTFFSQPHSIIDDKSHVWSRGYG